MQNYARWELPNFPPPRMVGFNLADVGFLQPDSLTPQFFTLFVFS